MQTLTTQTLNDVWSVKGIKQVTEFLCWNYHLLNMIIFIYKISSRRIIKINLPMPIIML